MSGRRRGIGRVSVPSRATPPIAAYWLGGSYPAVAGSSRFVVPFLDVKDIITLLA